MMDRAPLSYIFLAVFSAAAAVTSKDYFFPQLQSTYVACSKSTINTNATGDDNGGTVQSTSMKNTILTEEQWNQMKHTSCPKQIPNPSIWPILFAQARIELGFNIETIPNTPNDEEFVKNFFSFCNGGVGYTSLDGEHHLVYLKVWKSANDQIRKNIDR
eukprot:scaffold463_cov107-Skeletonema_dohrnii-CCMP3373.AAC.6